LPDKPYLLPQAVRSLRGVENIQLTAEDRKKGAMYREQTERKQQQSRYANLDEFLETLQIEVEILPATDFSIPRIAQLTQKTNQMNATTRRYTEADIAAMSSSDDRFVYAISAKDKFGDSGIIGVFILALEGRECRIDTFLLSCRVIGRNIEAAMLAFILEFARARGATAVLGEFLPTAKNAPAADLFAKHGFKKRTETLFEADVEKHDVRAPEYIRVSLARAPALEAQ
jgi:FkbH-like protein